MLTFNVLTAEDTTASAISSPAEKRHLLPDFADSLGTTFRQCRHASGETPAKLRACSPVYCMVLGVIFLGANNKELCYIEQSPLCQQCWHRKGFLSGKLDAATPKSC